MHTQLDVLGGIPGVNLTDVKWDDRAQRVGWFQQHAEQHRLEADVYQIFV
jgi:hypothetical protein